MAKYTVWVGGVEVNDYYLRNDFEAQEIGRRYLNEGYDDVVVVRTNDNGTEEEMPME